MPYESAMAKDNMWAQFYQVRFSSLEHFTVSL
jgi:hypothetical protein